MTKNNTTLAICIAALLCVAGASESSADENAAPPQTPKHGGDELSQRRGSSGAVKVGLKIVAAAGQSGSTNSPAPQTPANSGAGTDLRAGGAAISPQRQEFLGKYDKNGDGKLDSSELAAFRSALRENQKKAPAPSVVPPTKRGK